MALVEFGGGIVKMSGKIAGNVFGRNRSGDYVRAWKKPINPNTQYQDIIRAALAYLADRWHSALTAAQRAAWNLYAGNVVMKNKLGQATYLSGYNHYIRSNLSRKQFAIAIIDDGPTVFNLPAQDAIFDVTPDVVTNDLDITFDDGLDWCSEDGAHLYIFQGYPQGEQVNFFGGPWRAVPGIPGNSVAPPTSPQNNVPTTFTIGYNQRIWCYGRIMRADGRLSEPFRGDGLTGDAP